MRHLSEAKLKRLYFDYCAYRDIECGGKPNMGVEAFYGKFRTLYD